MSHRAAAAAAAIRRSNDGGSTSNYVTCRFTSVLMTVLLYAVWSDAYTVRTPNACLFCLARDRLTVHTWRMDTLFFHGCVE